MKKSQVQKIVQKTMKKVLIEESWVDTAIDNFKSITADTIRRSAGNAAAGALVGAGIGALLSAFGAISPKHIVSLSVAGAAGGFAMGIVTGKRVYIKKTMSGYVPELVDLKRGKAATQLIDITNARDELFKKAAANEKVGPMIKRLTKQQREAQKNLKMTYLAARANGDLSPDEIKIAEKIISIAEKGKLTYLDFVSR